jgi:hypothetical protein
MRGRCLEKAGDRHVKKQGRAGQRDGIGTLFSRFDQRQRLGRQPEFGRERSKEQPEPGPAQPQPIAAKLERRVNLLF